MTSTIVKNRRAELELLLKQRILLLDGAMGTMIQSYDLSEDDFRGDRFKDHPDADRQSGDGAEARLFKRGQRIIESVTGIGATEGSEGVEGIGQSAHQ